MIGRFQVGETVAEVLETVKKTVLPGGDEAAGDQK
jgi:hypothetical protein